MTGGRRIAARLTAFAMTKRFVILNAKRERIRNTLKRETDCRSRFAGSPAGSVGASALQRCPPDTRTFAMTGKRKYIRAPYGDCNDKEVKKDYRTPKGVR